MQAAADPFGDLFGVAPFEANGSGGGGAATAPAPAAIPPGRVQNLVDVFVSVPFSGAAGGTGSPPSGSAASAPAPAPAAGGVGTQPSMGQGGTITGGGGTQDLLHGWS